MSDTGVYVILGIIVCLALTLPLTLSSFNENKHRLPKPKLPSRGRTFRQFPLDEE